MSKNLSTPILLERDGKKYLLMNISFASNDDSMYITFPFKRKRYISRCSIKEYDKRDYSEHTRKLKKYSKENVDPKISFHPRDMIVHVNSNMSGGISDNYPILNVFPVKGMISVYLLQVILPSDVSFYDEYNKENKPNYVVIQYTPNNDVLCLEFIIHSNEIQPTRNALPICKNRNYRFGYNFDSGRNYSYSIFVSTLNGCNTGVILAVLNTKEKSCIYTIDNK